MTRDTRRKGFTLIELMVVIAIVATLMGLLLPAVLRARETGRRTTCINNQYQLAFAAQRHAESAGTLVGWRNLSPNPANTVRTANSIAAAVTPSARRSATKTCSGSRASGSSASESTRTSARRSAGISARRLAVCAPSSSNHTSKKIGRAHV